MRTQTAGLVFIAVKRDLPLESLFNNPSLLRRIDLAVVPAVLAQPALAPRQQLPRIWQAKMAADLAQLDVQELVAQDAVYEQCAAIPVRVNRMVPAEFPLLQIGVEVQPTPPALC